MKKPILFIELAFLSIAILFGCAPKYDYQIIQNWSFTEPQNPIIFQGDMQTSTEFFSLDAGKKGVQKIILLGNFVRPTWSSDGYYIYGLINPKWMNAYKEGGFPAMWDIRQEKLVACQKSLPHYWQITEYRSNNDPYIVILQNIEGIYLFDMKTCKNQQILVNYSDRSSGIGIYGFSYFADSNELIYGEKSSSTPPKYHIIKFNFDSGRHLDLAEGINPSWSRDGSRIAFTGVDGIYVMQATGDQIKKLINLDFSFASGYADLDAYSSYPRWSPDGNEMVFHYCTNQICELNDTPIYLLDIKTGRVATIFVGGMYPDWKP